MTDDRALRRIEKALTTLGSEHVPPPGWEERVMAATIRPRRPRWIAAGSVLAAAAAIVVWISTRPERMDVPMHVEVAIIRGGTAHRTDTQVVGDILEATVRGGKHRALWIYRDDRLVFACPGDSRCGTSGGALRAKAPLEMPGEYVVVALTHDEPLILPKGALDPDVAAAKATQAKSRIERRTVY